MEITGKIILKLPLAEGTSKAGNAWRKQEYVLETNDTYPKKVHFVFFGDRVDQYPLEVGDMITLSYDIESREFNGRWYTDIRGWKAEKVQPQQPAAAPAASAAQQPPVEQYPAMPAAPEPVKPDSDDDLPF